MLNGVLEQLMGKIGLFVGTCLGFAVLSGCAPEPIQSDPPEISTVSAWEAPGGKSGPQPRAIVINGKNLDLATVKLLGREPVRLEVVGPRTPARIVAELPPVVRPGRYQILVSDRGGGDRVTVMFAEREGVLRFDGTMSRSEERRRRGENLIERNVNARQMGIGDFLDQKYGGVSDGFKAGETSSICQFSDGTIEAGLAGFKTTSITEDLYTVEIMGHGVIFFDADRDGDPDLFVANGTTNIVGSQSGEQSRDRFLINDGSGLFQDRTDVSGLGDTRFSTGVCGADYDNDGDIDLYVTSFDAENRLYRNDGTARFEDVAGGAGVQGKGMMDSSCAFADVDGDGWLDLVVGYYVSESKVEKQHCEWPRRKGVQVPRHCGPLQHNPYPDMFFHNQGDGTFEDRSEIPGIGLPCRTLGVVFSDFDDDGDPDLFRTCDRTSNIYLENVGGLTFRDVSLLSGAALSLTGLGQAGMGVASGDFSGDGLSDLVATYYELEPNGLYRNLGNNEFEQVQVAAGTARFTARYISWGTELLDADLDGRLDWMTANGHAHYPLPGGLIPLSAYDQPNQLLLNRGDDVFEDVSSSSGDAFAVRNISRGLAVADIDNDGDLDVVVTNLEGPIEVLRNDTPRNGRHWLKVRTIGRVSNRDGVGAKVVAVVPTGALFREVRTGQSYLSQSDMTVHFGLGEHKEVDRLEVRWPSGTVTVLKNVAADQFLEVVEGA